MPGWLFVLGSRSERSLLARTSRKHVSSQLYLKAPDLTRRKSVYSVRRLPVKSLAQFPAQPYIDKIKDWLSRQTQQVPRPETPPKVRVQNMPLKVRFRIAFHIANNLCCSSHYTNESWMPSSRRGMKRIEAIQLMRMPR